MACGTIANMPEHQAFRVQSRHMILAACVDDKKTTTSKPPSIWQKKEKQLVGRMAAWLLNT